MKIKHLGTRRCLSLPKLNQDFNSKEGTDKNLASTDTLTRNEYEELIKFKNSIIDEFDALKLSFFADVNSIKSKYFNSNSNNVSINNSERLTKQLQDNVNFLRQQLKSKNEMINSLLQQLSKCDKKVPSNSNLNNTNMTVNTNDVNDITIVDSPHQDNLSTSEQLRNQLDHQLKEIREQCHSAFNATKQQLAKSDKGTKNISLKNKAHHK